jgi:hypothetical protein
VTSIGGADMRIITDRDIDAGLDRGWVRVGHYKNARIKIDLICPKGHQVSIRWDHYQNGIRCRFCSGYESLKNKDIDARLDNGWKRLSDYVNNGTPMSLMCPNGHITKMQWQNYQQGKRCIFCFKENNRGANHHSWKSWLTDEIRERYARKTTQYNEWRKAVYEKDGYTCRKCGRVGKTLEAHHLYGFHEHQALRYDVNNGVTMCKRCHIDFHRLYGKDNNTPQQFYNYVVKY